MPITKQIIYVFTFLHTHTAEIINLRFVVKDKSIGTILIQDVTAVTFSVKLLEKRALT